MYKIFISYSKKNKPFVSTLIEALSSFGYVLLWEEGILNVTDNIDKAISAAIREADIFIVLISPTSLYSQHVVDEIELATSLEKKR